MEYTTKTADETKKLGETFGLKLVGGETICLYGELGAGKTVFTGRLINYFLPKKRILSPTFIIVRHYPVIDSRIKNIYHADLYRMANNGEIESTGLAEFINKPDSVVLVEWAEKMGKVLPKKRIDIKFLIIDDNQRKITIQKI
ncbi:tRNA (adenosine(37)-N6)-threonylcarbamoyltransferase complex ATPase subunit type 1 TsaE [Candidatus Microgenomates bacterium]|nr:tRNA (adenosine(37)-N6)-threonylcarbamoyltransferase complex ATPase subunit type 1 TsaE [Candidatus Microgenomates bacterium]